MTLFQGLGFFAKFGVIFIGGSDSQRLRNAIQICGTCNHVISGDVLIPLLGSFQNLVSLMLKFG